MTVLMKDYLVIKMGVNVDALFSLGSATFMMTELGGVELYNEKGRIGEVLCEINAPHEFAISDVPVQNKLKNLSYMEVDKLEVVNIIRMDKHDNPFVVLKVTNGVYAYKTEFLQAHDTLSFETIPYRADILQSLIDQNKEVTFEIKPKIGHVLLYIKEHDFQITQGYISNALGCVLIDNHTFLSVNDILNGGKKLVFSDIQKEVNRTQLSSVIRFTIQ